jgi:hypothetical protein
LAEVGLGAQHWSNQQRLGQSHVEHTWLAGSEGLEGQESVLMSGPVLTHLLLLLIGTHLGHWGKAQLLALESLRSMSAWVACHDHDTGIWSQARK